MSFCFSPMPLIHHCCVFPSTVSRRHFWNSPEVKFVTSSVIGYGTGKWHKPEQLLKLPGLCHFPLLIWASWCDGQCICHYVSTPGAIPPNPLRATHSSFYSSLGWKSFIIGPENSINYSKGKERRQRSFERQIHLDLIGMQVASTLALSRFPAGRKKGGKSSMPHDANSDSYSWPQMEILWGWGVRVKQHLSLWHTIRLGFLWKTHARQHGFMAIGMKTLK